MRNLFDFKSLSETFGDETLVFVEMPDGSLYEIMGFQPTKKHDNLMIKLSSKPYDYREEYNGEE